MTVYEALKHNIPKLGSIPVPVSLIGSIGVPIGEVIRDLKACCEAIEQAESQPEQADEQPEQAEEQPKKQAEEEPAEGEG